MTNINTLLLPKLYQEGTLTLTARTGDMKIYVDRFLDGSGWRVSIDQKSGNYWDSDYQKFIDNWNITKQFTVKTADEVIEQIKSIFNIKQEV